MSAILALRRLSQENCEFKASLGHIARPCLKKIYKIPSKNEWLRPQQHQEVLLTFTGEETSSRRKSDLEM
jgi:hypothetical protein